MPVTNAKQSTRICKLSGTYLPARFKAIVDRFGDNPAAMKQAGVIYATECLHNKPFGELLPWYLPRFMTTIP